MFRPTRQIACSGLSGLIARGSNSGLRMPIQGAAVASVKMIASSITMQRQTVPVTGHVAVWGSSSSLFSTHAHAAHPAAPAAEHSMDADHTGIHRSFI